MTKYLALFTISLCMLFSACGDKEVEGSTTQSRPIVNTLPVPEATIPLAEGNMDSDYEDHNPIEVELPSNFYEEEIWGEFCDTEYAAYDWELQIATLTDDGYASVYVYGDMYLIIQYTPNLVSVGVYDSPAYSAEAYVEFTTDTPSSWIDIQVE